jgi:hypothetical protein
MRRALGKHLDLIPAPINRQLSEIDIARGRQEAFARQHPAALESLQQVALIHSGLPRVRTTRRSGHKRPRLQGGAREDVRPLEPQRQVHLRRGFCCLDRREMLASR